MDQVELQRLMDVLLAKKVELRRRTDAIMRDAASKLSADSGEQAVELENAEVLNELGREAIEELGKINLALARHETGRYGICTDCGEDISVGRLRAIPWALRCARCEANADERAANDGRY